MISALILLYAGAGVHCVLSRWAYLGSPTEDYVEALSEFFFWPRYLYKDFRK